MPSSPVSLRITLASCAAAAVALAVLALAPQRAAEAQGIMAAPACQCSVPTPIPGIASSVVHCLCGAMSCAITEHKQGGAPAANLMQCVK